MDTDWTLPRPEPVHPVGLTIYCEPPTTIHEACPGYSTTGLQEANGPAGRICGCSCHKDG